MDRANTGAPRSRPNGMKRVRYALAVLAISAAAAMPLAVVSATAAYAAPGPCNSGIYDWHSGWGGCSGTGWFQVRAYCTWGQTATSQPIYVSGGWSSIGVTCPYNTAIRSAPTVWRW